MRITRSEAIADGCTIDDYCYPPRAYKGERFVIANDTGYTGIHMPTYTELEDELLQALELCWTALMNAPYIEDSDYEAEIQIAIR
jgi:hypothetical protein